MSPAYRQTWPTTASSTPYAVTPQVETFLEASNPNNAPWRRYIGKESQMVENEQYGATVRVGFTVRK